MQIISYPLITIYSGERNDNLQNTHRKGNLPRFIPALYPASGCNGLLAQGQWGMGHTARSVY